MYKYVDPKEIAEKTGLGFPHTAHCLASGEILVSCLGDEEGNAKGNGFLLLDSDFNIKNRYLIAKQFIVFLAKESAYRLVTEYAAIMYLCPCVEKKKDES